MKIRYALPAIAAAAALALTGCVNNADNESGNTGGSGAVEGVQPHEAAIALLPEDIKEGGVLIMGTDADYPPNEFKDNNGNPVGWGVELAEAIAAKLDLEVEWQILGFDAILPRIEEGAVHVGASSFTDNLLRQEVVDFVNYLNAGSMWAAPIGSGIDPEDACGKTIGAQQGTIQETSELPARSEKCAQDGKEPIDIFKAPGQPAVTNAVVNGQADAFSADFPVTLDAVAQLSDELETVGVMFDTEPYGFAVQKNSSLAEAVQTALQSLIDDGTYLQILTAAGVESGAVETATINAGTSPGE